MKKMNVIENNEVLKMLKDHGNKVKKLDNEILGMHRKIVNYRI
jgi:hypothetical protein